MKNYLHICKNTIWLNMRVSVCVCLLYACVGTRVRPRSQSHYSEKEISLLW